MPWRDPLAEWSPTEVGFRDVPVGPSRHLVRFVEADGRLWALKEMPASVAVHEYEVLRGLETRSLPAVRAAGVVVQPSGDTALLVTHYLERSWQYRRLLMRVPSSMGSQRGRLFDAMALLMVDLHRNGVYWGDCSLANTLFMRDGQAIQAWMVDGETARLHPTLSDGQRDMDLGIMVENVAGGLLDVAARRAETPEATASVLDEAHSVAERYVSLWALLHEEPVLGGDPALEVSQRTRRLNELGFALDEVRLESTGSGLRMRVAAAERRFHSTQLHSLTGMAVGEGQATILLNDLRSYRSRLCREEGHDVAETEAARRWVAEEFAPRSVRAHAALGGRGDATQAYCDLLEVRWLLSEASGGDVGDEPALEALARRETPGDAAATLTFVDDATRELPAVRLED